MEFLLSWENSLKNTGLVLISLLKVEVERKKVEKLRSWEKQILSLESKEEEQVVGAVN